MPHSANVTPGEGGVGGVTGRPGDVGDEAVIVTQNLHLPLLYNIAVIHNISPVSGKGFQRWC